MGTISVVEALQLVKGTDDWKIAATGQCYSSNART
jgi:hypothetical protein